MKLVKTAVVFPGQGAQRPGMGQDFCENNVSARKIFEIASEALGEDMKELCFTEHPKLNLTEYTQPAILTTEIAMLAALKDQYGFEAQYFAGHSLGEYAALVAAGVIDFKDAVIIVKKRGQLMQAAVPEGVGAMAALLIDNIEQTRFKEITENAGAEIANFNSAGQVVISGKTEFVKKASGELQKEYPDMRIVDLPVSAPFHSSLMRVIEDEFKNFLGKFSFNAENSSNVLSNFKGDFHKPDQFIDNIVRQISGSVQWIQNMRVLKGVAEVIYEVGPNKVLSKFFSTIDVNVPAIINERSAKKTFEVET
ncbi:MAG: ACP S-malonyltransferase [Spirochaetia bacterium]|nr:ACP S-malonyltransferase [Spirochaetia bacterium]